MTQITDPKLLLYHEVVKAFEHWKPHAGQIKVGRALFHNDIRNIFVQCGRKWGKTEIGMYILWRWAMMNPGLGCYYVAPELKQGKRIVWEDPRMESFGPRSWIQEVNQSETRIQLINGSFLKLEGSENFEAHRGTRPGIVIYEEYKDHDPRFRNVMRPNLSVYRAPEVFLGTPPDRDCEYTEVAKEHQEGDRAFFHQAPTWENPLIDRDWLRQEKTRLYLRGEGDVWEREYAAKFVKGGATKIFPMFDESFVVPHEQLMKMVEGRRRKLEFISFADPAGATCFAILLAALDPYTKDWYIIDEIYETRQAEMSVRKIGPVYFQKREEAHARDWRQGYDEAATWFYNEMMAEYEEAFEPSHKHLNDKTDGLSLIKDIMNARKLYVSDRCKMFYWELDNYYKDKNGNIPKKNDHIIDIFRYMLGATYYNLRPEEIRNPDNRENFRGARIGDDFPGLYMPGERGQTDDLSDNERIQLWK
jgi:hypothetical protein